jgi:hypothetical protein
MAIALPPCAEGRAILAPVRAPPTRSSKAAENSVNLAGPPAHSRRGGAAQIAGWTLVGVLDLLNRQLTYRDLPVALVLTLIVTLCLALLSSVMRAIYASHALDNRLTRRALVLIASLSFALASTVALIIFTLRQMFGWMIPNWGPVEEIVIPCRRGFPACPGCRPAGADDVARALA